MTPRNPFDLLLTADIDKLVGKSNGACCAGQGGIRREVRQVTTTTETLPQIIRNYIARRSAAHLAELCRYLATCHGEPLPAVLAAIDRLEADGEVTRTETGAYVLGRHKAIDAGELVLTSNDSTYGQASLF